MMKDHAHPKREIISSKNFIKMERSLGVGEGVLRAMVEEGDIFGRKEEEIGIKGRKKRKENLKEGQRRKQSSFKVHQQT